MKKSYILSFITAAMMISGCSKENPFDGYSGAYGDFLKSALSVSIDADGLEVRTTRAAEADVDNFTVIFTAVGESQPTAKYKYGEMPEIVTLPAGKYTCTATYGENRDAEWEEPHFLGTSQEFTISPMEITSYIDPIECRLENIKVTVDFDPVLRSHMSKDSYVEVKVGSTGFLNFGIDEADSQKAAYFKHSEEITLVATFHGSVDGNNVVETKSMTDIKKGTHYKVTFKLHDAKDTEFNGGINTSVSVDATVDATDVSRNVPLIEDEIMDDSERPSESDDPNQGGDDPQLPDVPEVKAPAIVADGSVLLDTPNDANNMTSCILHIYSYDDKGIVELTCDIDSPVLGPDDLSIFGLDTHLDLAHTPDDMQDGLKTLGFPYNVAGQQYVKFDISEFVPVLGMVCQDHPGVENRFTITVKDAGGECTKTLILKY